MKNKFLFKGYYNLLLQQNKENLIFFCELNSFNSSTLRLLKKDLKKDFFLVKNIKTRLTKIFFNKNDSFKKLISGPLFLIYKDKFDVDKDLTVIRKFSNYNFLLNYVFNNKIYCFTKLHQMKKYSSINDFFNLIVHSINFLFFYNFCHMTKIIPNNT